MTPADLSPIGVGFGLAFALFHFVVTIARQRKLAAADTAFVASAFLSANNIPAGIYLAAYGLHPDPASLVSKLQGMDKYISLAGVTLTAAACVTLWGLFYNAWKQAPAGA